MHGKERLDANDAPIWQHGAEGLLRATSVHGRGGKQVTLLANKQCTTSCHARPTLHLGGKPCKHETPTHLPVLAGLAARLGFSHPGRDWAIGARQHHTRRWAVWPGQGARHVLMQVQRAGHLQDGACTGKQQAGAAGQTLTAAYLHSATRCSVRLFSACNKHASASTPTQRWW